MISGSLVSLFSNHPQHSQIEAHESNHLARHLTPSTYRASGRQGGLSEIFKGSLHGYSLSLAHYSGMRYQPGRALAL